MKEKLFQAAGRYIVVNLAFLPLLPVLRIIEYFILRLTPEFPENAIPVEISGLLYDLFAFTFFAFFMFIPFFFIFILNRKTGEIIYVSLLGLLTIIQVGIIKYFAVTLSPLDEVIFSFSLKEIMLILRSSVDLNIISFLPMIIPVLLLLFLQFLFKKYKAGKVQIFFIAGFGVAAILVSIIRSSVSAKDESDYTFYLKINKCSYFVKSSITSIFRSNSLKSNEQVVEDVELYQAIHDEFNFTGNNYPLLHDENTPDVLGPFFRLSHRPPNLVFIIVESLSSACIGDSSWFGNFTPFLDSLKNHGLYWDNFLSTSERTFHVLQALFGSLPYGSGEFQKDMAVIPNHYSLISVLKNYGYFTGFYYGGDASFTNYDQFLKKQGTDFILTYFDQKYNDTQLEYQDFHWGYQDEALFKRSLEVMDSLKQEPRIDIYLTLSMHFPFHPPRAPIYLDQVEQIMNKLGFSLDQKIRSAPFKELFSSVLYTDDAIRSFIKACSKRDDFNNTIFFITGDHAFTEFGNTTISAIEHYHVPMIIFSPLLKEARQFHSVSSHLDITPSILAMLVPVYNYKTEKYTHWLGQGIDTAVRFRNNHTMAFTRKNNKTEDYLKDDYYYSGSLLYKISDGFKTQPVKDDQKRQAMRDELSSTVTVYNYTNKKNLLLPSASVMLMSKKRDLIRTFDDHTLKTSNPGQVYFNLVSPSQLRSNFNIISVDIRFRYKISETADTSKFPLLTATIEDTNFKISLYHYFQFPDISTDKMNPGTWYTAHISENMNVSMVDPLKGKFMKLYFYYKESCKIQFDSIQVRLNGIN